MRLSRFLAAFALVAAILIACPRLGVAEAPCTGDCNGDGQVAINEMVTGVSSALGAVPVDACRAADANGDGSVSVGELVAAVNNALDGCGAVLPTPTPPAVSGTPTVTPTLATGPVIVHFGVLSADDTVQPPTATAAGGIPIYERPFGSGFSLVVEAAPGTNPCGSHPCTIGTSTFTVGGPPDLQVQATRPLGDGSVAVCDDGSGDPPIFGGVPGIDPPRLEDPNAIADALDDFGCRFIDGAGARVGRACAFGCVRFETGEFGCVDDAAVMQFCAPVPVPMQFPDGDTLVTARVRDAGGQLGPPAQIIVRVTP